MMEAYKTIQGTAQARIEEKNLNLSPTRPLRTQRKRRWLF